MKRTIQTIVDGMILQLTEYGAKYETIKTYQYGLCGPVIRYCNEKGDGYYSSQLLDSYLEEYKNKLSNGSIGQTYFSSVTRNLRLLKSFAETGQTDFTYSKQEKKFNPADEYWRLADRLLEDNGVSKGSRKILHTNMRHFFCFIETRELNLSNITDDTFFEFLESVSETNSGSMQGIMRSVRMISSYLKREGIANLHVDFSMLPMKYSSVHMIPPFSQEEVSRIISAIDTSTPIGMRDHAIMLFAFYTGLRGIDIIKLRIQDINWRKGTVSIIQSKTGHPVELPLKGTVMNSMADYILKVRPESDAPEVFLSCRPPRAALSGTFSLDYILEKYRLLSGVEKKPRRAFHSLRRSFATELSAGGVPLGEISEMLGHTNIRSDKPYLSYNKEQISFCAGNFSDIPVTVGIYAKFLDSSAKGGGK